MKTLITWTDGAGHEHQEVVDDFKGEVVPLKDGTVGRSIPRKRLKDQLGLFDPIQNNLFD